ncbi:hypothetical protein DUNSADRAFT_17777, partial [Dunaliella salina]
MTEDNGARLFVVCGKAVSEEDLLAPFHSFGNVTSLKLIKDKGVAYVRFDRASSAALAMESLNGATLNDGRGPKLKVLLAEAPSTRGLSLLHRQLAEVELSSDPDNLPPRSRLFLVVPKQADPQQIQMEAAAFPGLEYCKTDLVAPKGVVFLKFSKTSSALIALEIINERGTFAGYKVKAMLAVPKTKRGRFEGDTLINGLPQTSKLDYMDPLKLQMAAGLSSPMNTLDYTSLSSFPGFANNLSGLSTTFSAHMGHLPPAEVQWGAGASQGNLSSFMGNHLANSSPASSAANNAAGLPLSRQRLFVVIHKGVGEEAIARLFRRYPGMEYCDLKKDRETGKSKGYCYINYSTPEAAAAAVTQLNGSEFPPFTGHKIKVMFAEPLGVRPSSSLATGSQTPPDLTHLGVSGSSPSPLAGAHTPLSGTHTTSLTPDPIS